MHRTAFSSTRRRRSVCRPRTHNHPHRLRSHSRNEKGQRLCLWPSVSGAKESRTPDLFVANQKIRSPVTSPDTRKIQGLKEYYTPTMPLQTPIQKRSSACYWRNCGVFRRRHARNLNRRRDDEPRAKLVSLHTSNCPALPDFPTTNEKVAPEAVTAVLKHYPGTDVFQHRYVFFSERQVV